MQNPIYQEKKIFREYRYGKEIWMVGFINKCIGRLMYIIKDPKKTIKWHHNQIRKRYPEDISNQKEESMKVIYNLWGFLLSPEKPGLFLRFVKE